ncbi:hypothetical protein PROFUN_07974 [Planoprotostelium fungivorum]|uniref:Uncharacterized protein n=1 Tax=Planoprotostelium fungivorum TaxID=1890364 RepID=A0A2P6MV63_9EUKA|nr:hypothetical protein PROFUN_07974 [Planoprotostelium fungivorum]
MPILSPILVRPSLGQKKQSKHKDSQDMGSFRASCRKKMNSWGLPGSNNLSEPSGEERAAEFNSESVALGSIHALTNE